MIRRHIFMSAAAATVMLSSCSGGNDATPTPSPTATATPTPTPTASPTYLAFPLSAAAEFLTLDAYAAYTGDPATGAVTLNGLAGTESYTDRVRLAVSNAPTTGTFVFRDASEEARFAAVTPTTASATGNVEFVYRTDSTTTAGLFSEVAFLNNLSNATPTTVTSDPLYGSLTRVSYATWFRGDSTAGQKRLTYAVFGYGTGSTDVPTTGTVTYTTKVTGRVVHSAGGTSAINKIGGTVNTTVNFSTGVVDLAFNLTQTTPGGVTTAYATFNAQGARPTGQFQFNGSFTSGAPLSGTFTGAFYGSAAEQIGITFAGNSSTDRLVGNILGKKP